MEEKKVRSLELFYDPECKYCQATIKWIEDHGIENIVYHNLATEPNQGERLLEIGGQYAYPCLIEDGHAIYGEDKIIEFLTALKGEKEQDIAR